MDIFEKINEFEKDEVYFLELLTIVTLLDGNDLDELYKLIESAQKDNKKLFIYDEDIKDWEYDSITIERIKKK